MYQIYINNQDGQRYILHDSRSSDVRVISPVCDLELNKTGTLKFKINPKHPNFDKIHKHTSEVYLTQDGECLFCGRVLNDEVDIYNFKQIECEGMLSYLLDSCQRAKGYTLTSISDLRTYLNDIISIHNSQIDEYKRFSIGNVSNVDISNSIEIISNYKDTLTTLNSGVLKLFDKTYLISYVDNGVKKIDLIKSEDMKSSNQIIKFGENLLKLSRKLKGEEIATAILPLGTTVDSDETELGNKVDYKLTISELPNGLINDNIYKQNDYIYDINAIREYGFILKVVECGDVEEPSALVDRAIEQLNYYSKLAYTIELNAFDLHLLDVNVDSIRVGEKIRVYSKIHDLDVEMLVIKMSIDLDSPDKTTIYLGNEERKIADSSKSISDKASNITTVENELNNLDYVSSYDVPSYVDTYMNDSIGTGNVTDLSLYATKNEVQTAFDSLANALRGL